MIEECGITYTCTCNCSVRYRSHTNDLINNKFISLRGLEGGNLGDTVHVVGFFFRFFSTGKRCHIVSMAYTAEASVMF